MKRYTVDVVVSVTQSYSVVAPNSEEAAQKARESAAEEFHVVDPNDVDVYDIEEADTEDGM